jgi:hypothetical protein
MATGIRSAEPSMAGLQKTDLIFYFKKELIKYYD